MRSAKMCAVIGLTIIGLCLSCTAIASEEKENKAVKAAEEWLTLVDKGQYGESWETAAIYFRNSITKANWSQALTAVRKPLGNMVSREVQSKIYTASLPGAPDGEYVVLEFATSFEKKRSAIETITPMLDIDGEWRVSGYYIK